MYANKLTALICLKFLSIKNNHNLSGMKKIVGLTVRFSLYQDKYRSLKYGNICMKKIANYTNPVVP